MALATWLLVHGDLVMIFVMGTMASWLLASSAFKPRSHETLRTALLALFVFPGPVWIWAPVAARYWGEANSSIVIGVAILGLIPSFLLLWLLGALLGGGSGGGTRTYEHHSRWQ
jgi:hypothetical protein